MIADALKRIPFLYHFTDRRNLDLIRKLGGLYPLAELQRRGITVPAPGGNEWSWDANGIKGFDEYVHLCFRARTRWSSSRARKGASATRSF
jgi:hypothetical protein